MVETEYKADTRTADELADELRQLINEAREMQKELHGGVSMELYLPDGEKLLLYAILMRLAAPGALHKFNDNFYLLM